MSAQLLKLASFSLFKLITQSLLKKGLSVWIKCKSVGLIKGHRGQKLMSVACRNPDVDLSERESYPSQESGLLRHSGVKLKQPGPVSVAWCEQRRVEVSVLAAAVNQISGRRLVPLGGKFYLV